MTTHTTILDNLVESGSDLVRIVATDVRTKCDRLAVISEEVHAASDKRSLPDLVNDVRAINPALADQYEEVKAILAAIVKDMRETVGETSGETDALVDEAVALWKNVKTAVTMLQAQDDVDADFSATFLPTVPQVPGARMIVTAPGEVKRYRVANVNVFGTDCATFSVAAQIMTKNKVPTTPGDLGMVFASNGGPNAEAGTVLNLTVNGIEVTVTTK